LTTTERTDLVGAVMASRLDVAPGLDAMLLEAIVDAETAAAGDAAAAMSAIDAAVTAAMERGVGRLDGDEAAKRTVAEPAEDEEDEG